MPLLLDLWLKVWLTSNTPLDITATGQVVCFLGGEEQKSASLSEQGYGVQEQWLPLGQPDDVWGWMQASTLGTASMYHNFSFEE